MIEISSLFWAKVNKAQNIVNKIVEIVFFIFNDSQIHNLQSYKNKLIYRIDFLRQSRFSLILMLCADNVMFKAPQILLEGDCVSLF